ncbi:MAG: YkgJ family cysteine cluster protein [Nitrospirae bacterium]|nr:YkgJ family cysteine cluster protein [Nitrospirota bacterium]
MSSPIVPTKLTPESPLRFACHKGVSCFTKCCRDTNILLTPYDILRLKTRLGLTADEFLLLHALPDHQEKTGLPVAKLRTLPEEGNRCAFLTPEGCSVYEDRPVICRYYPLGLGIFKEKGMEGKDEFYFLVKEPHCLGHEEPKEWTVAEWRKDQQADWYDEQNRGWVEIIMRVQSMGPSASLSDEAKQMFFLASTNIERFRRFVLESSFLKKFAVDEETREQIRTDDVALLKLGYAWLKSILFGDDLVKARPEALEAWKEKMIASGRLTEQPE